MKCLWSWFSSAGMWKYLIISVCVVHLCREMHLSCKIAVSIFYIFVWWNASITHKEASHDIEISWKRQMEIVSWFVWQLDILVYYFLEEKLYSTNVALLCFVVITSGSEEEHNGCCHCPRRTLRNIVWNPPIWGWQWWPHQKRKIR